MKKLTLTLVVFAVLLATATAAQAVKSPPESYAAFQKQIAAKQVAKATVSPAKHVVRVKLKSGTKYEVTYPAASQAALVSSLRSSGAKVHVDKKKKKSSSGFRLRYIALIAVVLIVLIAVGVYFFQRRSGGSAPPPATTASQ